MSRLSEDVILYLSSFLDVEDGLSLSQVCRKFWAISQLRVFWIRLLRRAAYDQPLPVHPYHTFASTSLAELRIVAKHNVALNRNLSLPLMSTRRQAQSQEIQARDLLFLVPGTPFFVFAQVLKEPSVEDDEGDDEDDEEEASSRHSTSEVDPAPSGNDIGMDIVESETTGQSETGDEAALSDSEPDQDSDTESSSDRFGKSTILCWNHRLKVVSSTLELDFDLHDCGDAIVTPLRTYVFGYGPGPFGLICLYLQHEETLNNPTLHVKQLAHSGEYEGNTVSVNRRLQICAYGRMQPDHQVFLSFANLVTWDTMDEFRADLIFDPAEVGKQRDLELAFTDRGLHIALHFSGPPYRMAHFYVPVESLPLCGNGEIQHQRLAPDFSHTWSPSPTTDARVMGALSVTSYPDGLLLLRQPWYGGMSGGVTQLDFLPMPSIPVSKTITFPPMTIMPRCSIGGKSMTLMGRDNGSRSLKLCRINANTPEIFSITELEVPPILQGASWDIDRTNMHFDDSTGFYFIFDAKNSTLWIYPYV